MNRLISMTALAHNTFDCDGTLVPFGGDIDSADVDKIKAEYERRSREIPSDFYSWIKPANLMIHQHAAWACIDVLKRGSLFPLNGRKVADVGCGSGAWLLEFIQWGADPGDLAGIDLMADRVASAQHRIPQADLRVGSAAQLPWPDESFHVVTQMLMFENLLDPDLVRAAAREMLRVLKPGGGILWFDLRVGNPRNSTIRGFKKQEIRSVFPGCRVTAKPAVLVPPLARMIAPRFRLAAEVLSSLPFLRSHYAALIQKPDR